MPLCRLLELLLRLTPVVDTFQSTYPEPFSLTSTSSPTNPHRCLICCPHPRRFLAACRLLAWVMVRLSSSTSRRAFFLRPGHGGCFVPLERSTSTFSMAGCIVG